MRILGTLVALAACAALTAGGLLAADTSAGRLVTGKRLTPQGRQTAVGSFPANLVLSPDGRYLLVTDIGSREYVSVLNAADGTLVSRLDFNAPSPFLPKKKQALYFGLVCGKTANGQTAVYASRGGEGMVSVLILSADGTLQDTGKTLAAAPGISAAADPRPFLAGLALSRDGGRLYAADNSGDPKRGLRSSLYVLGTDTGTVRAKIDLPGYPYAVAALTAGPRADKKVYVSSEQRGVVSVIDPVAGQVVRDIPTGAQPIGLTLDRTQARLFVANAGSDTLSVIDTKTDRVTHTLLLRPDNARGLPGATPTGLALAPDEKRLYVTLADMNAVAVVELPSVTLAGYLPVGWYPTSAVVSPDGRQLFVANAKGVAARNPNGKPVAGLTSRPQYIQNIIEGTVSMLDLSAPRDLKRMTAQVLANQGRPGPAAPFAVPGIKHVFYVIKENRTYDQVLGDLAGGNGDPALTLFGREVTPNQHALAERFVLLDNFYDCAEVSGDGWNWSTAGMTSEYTSRNVPHNYAGRARSYDFEGTNGGLAVDRIGLPDVARPPSGYLWDLCAVHGVGLRNYGFFADDLELPRTTAEQGTLGLENSPTKSALVGKSDPDFRQFDMDYPDSEAGTLSGVPAAPTQRMRYGAANDPSRISAWKREFAAYVKNSNLPPLSLVRLPRDHTAGTTPGASSPRAMVADNDYAVGQLVETISHSSYWNSSAIVIVEDDAQNGFDHVDAHRSTAYVISPFIARATRDSRFYNTDSALRTIELLLGLPPMSQYDALASPLAVFGPSAAANAAPYDAILPDKSILAEVNGKRAYRAQDSARLLNPLREESGPDEQLNDILWRSLRPGTMPPPRHYGLLTGTAAKKDDD